MGQIDDAFLSRTSVALTYKTLDTGKQRHIWQGFQKKLAEERKDIVLTDRAKKFLENLDKDETTKDVPWNGREIRNGAYITPSNNPTPIHKQKLNFRLLNSAPNRHRTRELRRRRRRRGRRSPPKQDLGERYAFPDGG